MCDVSGGRSVAATPDEPVREWCCKTPLSEPHVPGCSYEPRPDNLIDYSGPAVARPPVGDTPATIDDLVQASSDSLFAPETLEDIRCRLSFIAASECNCPEGPHENALHDLADDDVPVLLRVIEQMAAEIARLSVPVTGGNDE